MAIKLICVNIYSCENALLSSLQKKPGNLKREHSRLAATPFRFSTIFLPWLSVPIILLDHASYSVKCKQAQWALVDIWNHRLLGQIYPSSFSMRLTNMNVDLMVSLAHPLHFQIHFQTQRTVSWIFKKCSLVVVSPGVMTHSCNSSIWEAETRGLL